jgi:hypothetical protein
MRIFNLLTGAQAKIMARDQEETTYADEYQLQSDDFNSATQAGERFYGYAANPRNAIKFLTVSDTTFLLNTRKVVEENSVKTADYEKAALVFVTQGDFGKNYNIEFGTPTTFAQVSFGIRNYVYSYDDDDDDG